MQIRIQTRSVTCVFLIFLVSIASIPLQAATLESSWTTGVYKIRAPAGKAWSEARNAVRMNRGWIFARNDAKNLYLLVDMTGDVTNDSPKNRHPWGDFVSLTFDIDRNGKITPKRDIQYAQQSGTYKLRLQRANAQKRFTGNRPTKAKLYAGFTSTPVLRRQHRVWEFIIPLKELTEKPGGKLRFGISVHSERPKFSDSLPSNYLKEIRKFTELRLASNPMIFHMVNMATVPSRVATIDRVIIRPDFRKFRPSGGNLTVVPPPPGTCPMPKGDPVKRAILPNGFIELTYANGTKKRQIKDGWEFVCPDGSVFMAQVIMKSTINPTMDPTELPGGEGQGQLLLAHEGELLNIIGALVDNDETMVQNYLATEEEDWDVIERIGSRGRLISFLLAE